MCFDLGLPDLFCGVSDEFRLPGEFDADLHIHMPTHRAGIKQAFVGDEQGHAVGNAVSVYVKLQARATDAEIDNAASDVSVVLSEENGRFSDRKAGGLSFIQHRPQANAAIVNEFQPEQSQMLVWL